MKVPTPVYELSSTYVYVMEADGDAPPGWVSLKQHNSRPTPWTGYSMNWGAGDRYLVPTKLALQGDGKIWGAQYLGVPIVYRASTDTYHAAYGWLALREVASSVGYSEYGYNTLREFRVALPNNSGVPTVWRIFADDPHGYPIELRGERLIVVPVRGWVGYYLRTTHNLPDALSVVWMRK